MVHCTSSREKYNNKNNYDKNSIYSEYYKSTTNIILLNKTYKRLIEYRHGMHGFARFIIGEIKARTFHRK